MKKSILIFILSAMLTACGNITEEEKAETTAVSPTTSTAAVTASESKTTSAAYETVSAAETTSTSKITTTTTKTETDLPKTTTTKKTSEASTTTRQQTQSTEAHTYVTYYDEPATETQPCTEPEVRVTESNPTTTTAPTAPSGITWSDSMKVWRKLCEGKQLSGSEQDIIRKEILDYAVNSFNGKKDIHVSFGIDEYDISYEKPLNLKIRSDMKDISYAHMDAYADADCSWLIDYASSEQEIHDIVSDTRQSCLHVIDYGLFNRWEIYSINGALKYASDIEFNVGFEDTAIWFLTED